MEIIKGLKQYQAIKFGGSFVVALPPYGTIFEVCGVSVENTPQVVVESLGDIKRVIPPKKVVVMWERWAEGITPVHYTELQRNLSRHYDDDLDQMIFPSVDDEVEYVRGKAILAEFKPVYEESERQLEPVEITLVGSSEPTGSDFITTPFEYGEANFKGSSGVYKVETSKIAFDALSKYKVDNPDTKIDNPTHSNVRFCIVGGEYVFSGSKRAWVESKGSVNIVTLLKDAQALESEIRGYINAGLDLFCKPTKASDIQVKDLRQTLNRVMTGLRSLEVKQKSSNSYNSLLTSLEREINNYGEYSN